MSDPTWVFARGDERLIIRREESNDGCQLVVGDGPDTRIYEFRDHVALVKFQSDMEALLLQTGWSFMAFEPDQRTGLDRREWPRLASDRRRWWTDSRRQWRENPLRRGTSWLRGKLTPR